MLGFNEVQFSLFRNIIGSPVKDNEQQKKVLRKTATSLHFDVFCRHAYLSLNRGVGLENKLIKLSVRNSSLEYRFTHSARGRRERGVLAKARCNRSLSNEGYFA